MLFSRASALDRVAILQPDVFNLLLLVVELFLLIVTIGLLILNRREQHGRDTLLTHLSAATDVVSRQEYFVSVLDSIQTAKKYIHGIVTGSAPPPQEAEVIHKVVDAISQAVARGVDVRYLFPHSPERLQVAQQYVKAGANVRFNPAVLVRDARYMLVDDKSVVIGVPERKGTDEPTRRGYVVPSETVAAMFREEFEKSWTSSETKGYRDYLTEVVTRARQSNPKISAELIASNLRIPKEEIELLLRDQT
jgi:phosphatidylserine/phosphatidylglycerophosphate/cardiolipin synthase-like enzyme